MSDEVDDEQGPLRRNPEPRLSEVLAVELEDSKYQLPSFTDKIMHVPNALAADRSSCTKTLQLLIDSTPDSL